MQGLSDLLAGDQITGTRCYQEDSYRMLAFRARDGAPRGDLLLIVADGMGGHLGGAKASAVAASTFAGHFAKTAGGVRQRLRQALEAANAEVGGASTRDPRYAGMGCTLLACVVAGDAFWWISVGDSVLWLLGDDGLRRLNADHSMRPVLEALVGAGRMTPEDLARDASANQLRSAVMGDELTLVDEGEAPRPLRAGDQLVLASDGVQTLSAAEIARACGARSTAAEVVSTLLRMVEDAGRSSQDNTTVVVYRHTGPGSVRSRFAELEAPTRPVRRRPAGS